MQRMEAQVVLPGRQRLRGNERGQSPQRAGLPHPDAILPIQPRRGEKGGPVHPGCLVLEMLALPDAIGIAVSGRSLARGVGLREGSLQGQHTGRPLVRAVESRE